MLSSTYILAALSVTSTSVFAQEPLTDKHFTWPNIPYQVSGDDAGARGPQFGFNLCNSTTQNQGSDCQTMFVNSLLDFCMWSSPKENDTIGESEAYEVAWCTKTGHGTRLIPPGAITGAQLLYAKNYIQVVGFINQAEINLQPGDYGGELDPHGADAQGNPLGGIVFTNGFGMNAASFDSLVTSGATPSTDYTQVIEWVDFVGNDLFCIKICNPDDSEAPELCQHIYDEIGCTYNAPADYNSINGTFQVCDSDDMTPPGVFVTGGTTTTWFQPFTGGFTVPYQVSIPQSSNCHTYSSEQLFATAFPSGQVTATTTSTSSGASATGGSSGGSGSASGSRSGSASNPASRTSTGATTSDTSNSNASPSAGTRTASPLFALTAFAAMVLAAPFFFFKP